MGSVFPLAFWMNTILIPTYVIDWTTLIKMTSNSNGQTFIIDQFFLLVSLIRRVSYHLPR